MRTTEKIVSDAAKRLPADLFNEDYILHLMARLDAEQISEMPRFMDEARRTWTDAEQAQAINWAIFPLVWDVVHEIIELEIN